ncbi:uncharacterized protein ACMZJ9_020981 [Mantella aurantiaca]
MYGDTLRFSEEEWSGLTSWQKDLYRTVIRDTADLLHSLGFVYPVRDGLKLKDGHVTNKSAEENLLSPVGAIIEEISGENFIIQITEISVVKQEETSTLQSSGDGFVSLDTETLRRSGDGLVSLDAETLRSSGDGLVSLDAETLRRSGDGLVSLDAETFRRSGDGLVSLDTETLRRSGDGLMSLDTETSIIPSLRESHVTGNVNFMKIEDVSNLHEDRNVSCDPGSVLCNPTDVLPMGSEGQALTATFFSGTDFLTVIQVEDTNVGSAGDLGAVHTELWNVHSGSTNVPWNRKIEATDKQPESVFPVSFVVPNNTIISRPSWIGVQEALVVATPQWCEEFPVADGRDNWSAPPVEWTQPHNVVAPHVSKSFQCSVCKKSFLYSEHLKSHEKIHKVDTSTKQPTCETHLSSELHLLKNQETCPISSHRDHVVSTDETVKLFSCTDCGRTFSYLFQFNRHQKIHARDKLLPRPVAPPPKKVYKLPQFVPARSRDVDMKLDSTGDSCRKLHQHLQLSTAFLQNLLTSTCGFQYD